MLASHAKMIRKKILYSLFVLVFVVFQHQAGNTTVNGQEADGFVKTTGSQFMLNGNTFYLNGFNAYWLMMMAYDPAQRVMVTSALQQASRSGLTVARTWAFNDGDFNPLQISPGSYSEVAFKGLDFVVAEAKKNGIYLILSLVNNYADFGGRQRYVKWARERGQNVSSDDDFYKNDVIKGFYKDYVKVILTRINTITGVAYKDDPAIFAWELINEPRCEIDPSGTTVQDWIIEMVAHVKSIDNNHLLEIGLEGFYGGSNPEKKLLNPRGNAFGCDFIPNNQIPGIDFATIHAYPDIWFNGSDDRDQLSYLQKWTEAHIQDTADHLKKPLLIAELGKSLKDKEEGDVSRRNSFIGLAYSIIYESARNGGPLSGGLFWQLLAPGMDKLIDGYEIVLPESPTTATLISTHSGRLTKINRPNKHR